MELDRRPVGDARAERQDGFLFFGVHVDELLHFRPWADDAHVAEEDVDKLGKFVEFEFADDVADFCYPHVAAAGGVGADFVGVWYHAAEFEDTERFAVAADTYAPVKHRAGGIELDGDGEGEEDR